MISRLFFIFFIFVSVKVVNAQKGYNLYIGQNISVFNLTNELSGSVVGTDFGYDVGMGYTFSLNIDREYSVSFDPEIYIRTSNIRYVNEKTYNIDNEYQMRWLGTQLMFNYAFAYYPKYGSFLVPYIGLGAYSQLLLAGTQKTSTISKDLSFGSSGFNAFDFGFSAQLGLDFRIINNNSMFFRFKFDYGLLDIEKVKFKNLKTKMMYYSITIGVHIE